MLVIRMQRTGRKGHAQFRVVVQDSRRTPTSGKVVASLGHFNPHTKETTLDKEKAQFYLEHGAQPSPRVVRLLKTQKVKLPSWVSEPSKGERKTRNPEKRRSTAPAEEKPAESDTPAEDTVIETADEQPKEPAKVESSAADDSKEESKSDEAKPEDSTEDQKS